MLVQLQPLPPFAQVCVLVLVLVLVFMVAELLSFVPHLESANFTSSCTIDSTTNPPAPAFVVSSANSGAQSCLNGSGFQLRFDASQGVQYQLISFKFLNPVAKKFGVAQCDHLWNRTSNFASCGYDWSDNSATWKLWHLFLCPMARFQYFLHPPKMFLL
jgi:hypothetical protein